MSDDSISNIAELDNPPNRNGELKPLTVSDPLSLARRLLRQPTMRTTIVFGFSGLAFALGSLLLARTMPVEAFGRLSLAIALFNVFGLLTPLGIDQVLLRHHIDPGPRLLALLGLIGLACGGLIGGGYSSLSGQPAGDGFWLAIAIASGGVVATLVALARAHHRERAALLLVTIASWLLLLIGVLSLWVPMPTPEIPLALFAMGNLVTAVLGWSMLGKQHRVPLHARAAIPWRESFSLLGIAAIGTLMLQLERLVIPPLLDMSQLALFSVLASAVIFPFRLLTASAGFSLVPKLRAAKSRREKLNLVRHELLSALALLALSTLVIVLLAPYAAQWLTDGRYAIGLGLALAACFNGYGKVMQSFPRALVTACGDERDIAQLNRLGWIGLSASIVGAAAGAAWGLTGLLYGITLGSMAGTLPAILLAKRKFDE